MLEPVPLAFNPVLMAFSLRRVGLLQVQRACDKKVAIGRW